MSWKLRANTRGRRASSGTITANKAFHVGHSAPWPNP